MALELPNSMFFHVGRTAGHWVRYVIKRMDIPTTEVGAFHDWPSRINMTTEQSKKLSFCFIRHPLDWLRSYWMHQMYHGWDDCSYSRYIKSDNFSEFLANAIEAYPSGPVSIVYAPFLDQCSFIGRQESLVNDMVHVLGRARESFVPEILYKTKSKNAEIPEEFRQYAVAPENILKEIMIGESELCNKWGYSCIPPSMIGKSRTMFTPYVPFHGRTLDASVGEDLKQQQFDNAFRIGELCMSGK
jgi:hypothetical protein